MILIHVDFAFCLIFNSFVTAEIVLSNINTGEIDTVIAKDVENSKHFSYIDNQANNCEMNIYEDGLCLFRQTSEYLLELNLTNKSYAKMSSKEGEFKFDVKIIDFHVNNDILVMRYKIGDEEREIKVIFRS